MSPCLIKRGASLPTARIKGVRQQCAYAISSHVIGTVAADTLELRQELEV